MLASVSQAWESKERTSWDAHAPKGFPLQGASKGPVSIGVQYQLSGWKLTTVTIRTVSCSKLGWVIV